MIEKGLEDGEVADVLVGQFHVESLDVLRHFGGIHLPGDALQFLRHLPEQRLHATLDVEVEQAQLEHVLRLLLDLQKVVPGLIESLFAEPLVDLDDLADQLVIGGQMVERLGRGFLDGPKGAHDQHGMMRNDGPTRLGNDVRMRHALVVADVHDVVDDVVGVLLHGVVHRGVEGRARAVVVDGQPAADVEIFQRVAELVKLGVVHGCFANGALDGQDVGNLGADVEMEQPERRLHPGLA